MRTRFFVLFKVQQRHAHVVVKQAVPGIKLQCPPVQFKCFTVLLFIVIPVPVRKQLFEFLLLSGLEVSGVFAFKGSAVFQIGGCIDKEEFGPATRGIVNDAFQRVPVMFNDACFQIAITVVR